MHILTLSLDFELIFFVGVSSSLKVTALSEERFTFDLSMMYVEEEHFVKKLFFDQLCFDKSERFGFLVSKTIAFV
jgi:hypothetical protein